ncbi:serine-threonine protein kinase [Planoprotostelium fungivorum]|uniref:Serine-threonine protein kinase n=1 Tax=Planoprotostelium fungivorum TaxID=1890364 RepID=A0A2P6N0W1_9EUKA|nr:serine-threonine protein kinase [Planoprotostelium fungivorum]
MRPRSESAERELLDRLVQDAKTSYSSPDTSIVDQWSDSDGENLDRDSNDDVRGVSGYYTVGTMNVTHAFFRQDGGLPSRSLQRCNDWYNGGTHGNDGRFRTNSITDEPDPFLPLSDASGAHEKRLSLEMHNERLEVKLSDIKTEGIITRELGFIVKKARVHGIQVVVTEFIGKEEDHELFAYEAKALHHLRHNHIMQFIGYTCSPPCIVYDYSDVTPLSTLLLRKSLRISHDNIFKTLMAVARAMSYIHSQTPEILHKRLNCKAVMISDNWNDIKLTNFANTSYETALPLQITLPEGKVYTTKSDCYMYGVLIWECLTRVIATSSQMATIHIPKTCPPFLKDLMTSCWHKQSNERPDFRDITFFLKKMNKWFAQKHNSPIQTSYQCIQLETAPEASGEAAYSYCTEREEKESRDLLSTLWRDLGSLGGACIMTSSFGNIVHLVPFDTIHKLKQAELTARYERDAAGIYEKIESISCTRFERSMYEAVRYDLQPDARLCLCMRFNISRHTESKLRDAMRNLLPSFRSIQGYRGILCMWLTDTSNLCLFLDEKESFKQLKRSGIVPKLWCGIVEQCGLSMPSFTRYDVLSTWLPPISTSAVE